MSRILVVDDDRLVREMLRDFLEGEGHEVAECDEGARVPEKIAETPPDLIFLDLVMPGMSGEHLATAIKGDEQTRHIPIIILTSESDEETRAHLLDLGVEEFLSKPFSPHQLAAKVRSLLKAKELDDRLLASFRGVELLEHLNLELIQGLHETAVGGEEFLMRALEHWGSWGGLGAPTHLWVCTDRSGTVEGTALYRESGRGDGHEAVLLPRPRLLEYLEPYRQASGTFWADEISPRVLKALWPTPPVRENLAGVLEGGLWVLASGYAGSVSTYDCRWLASLARQYRVFSSFINQMRATEEAFQYTLEALARAAEVHDDSTGLHIRRVNAFSGFLAQALGCDLAFSKALGQTAMMHDVGKIHVRPEILQKTGPLDPVEMEAMKKHTVFGARILGDSPRLLLARDIALSHHEKWDGSGYPAGLRGEAIPLSARIVALADVYDALRSQRFYKAPLAHEEAVRILKRGDMKTRPGHFDPTCLEAFLDISNHMDELFGRFGDGFQAPVGPVVQ
jgi:response regulator RpfG family c-di-GMP phosphodiesterase